MNNIYKIIEDSTNQALRAKGVIVPWKASENVSDGLFYACPWLQARAEVLKLAKEEFWEKVDTLIILQDWGCEDDPEKFCEAVKSVIPFFDSNPQEFSSTDTTLNNLWNEISAETLSGTTALTNVVWGRRKVGLSKTGYLGTRVHREWFKNLANEVITHFLEGKSDKPKKIIFCGEWARDWGAKEFTMLESKAAKTYLNKYANWAEEGKNESCRIDNAKKFEIYFFRHPSASGPWLPRSTESGNEELDFKPVGSFKWS